MKAQSSLTMPHLIFDTQNATQKKKRTLTNLSNHDFLFQWCSKQTLERLELIKRDFKTIAQIGARDTHTAKTLAQNANTYTIIDSINAPNQTIASELETIPLQPQSQDLIISNLELHNINDIPGTLHQIKNSLKPDGLFMASLFGLDTLHELKTCLMQAELELSSGTSPRIHPFIEKQDAGAIMQRSGFALPVIDSETVTVTYDNIFKLMEDIRGMGESNSLLSRSKNFTPRSLFMRAAELYQENFTEQGTNRIEATFNIIFLLGWAPHENQQKPLKPGSAQKSLAEALHTKEQKP